MLNFCIASPPALRGRFRAVGICQSRSKRSEWVRGVSTVGGDYFKIRIITIDRHYLVPSANPVRAHVLPHSTRSTTDRGPLRPCQSELARSIAYRVQLSSHRRRNINLRNVNATSNANSSQCSRFENRIRQNAE